jgi:energy-coupling factor transport system ATP-binding protein
MISIQHLTYRFRGGHRDALHDVNLEVAPGEFLVLTGPSGCGKSTLALAIGGYLYRQYDGQASGAVSVGGIDVRRRPIYDVAEVVGLVQQNPEAQFCTLTVRDEVAFGLENRRLPVDEIEERMAWALGVVGAARLVDRALATLSGGEKQRVAIAAVMAARPQVLILDEPTSNLDPTATAEVLGVISRLRDASRALDQAPMTVIVIEHKVSYLRPHTPRMVAMDRGRVVHDGAMLLRDPLPGRRAPGVPRARAAHGTAMAARVQDLHAGYGGSPVLHGVSLEVYPGEFVAVMGDNGSGKTTWLQSLLGLLKPDAGSVRVLERDTRHTPVSELARRVAYVFQNPDHQLFADSVWSEATYAPRNFEALDERTAEQVGRLLERCGLGERREDHPYRLSYGEKRRLNLVSVLGYNPQLILLDEMLIGQDPANAAFLLDLLVERVEEQGTVIMVNHSPEVTRRYASWLVYLQAGGVLVDAPTKEGFRQLAALGREAYLPSTGGETYP